MDNTPDVEGLLRAIERKTGGLQCALIVIDTLSRSMTGDENDTRDMNAFVRGCDRLREATGAAVLVVHHSGWSSDERMRGSTVLMAAADSVVAVTREQGALTGTLECKKQKDASEFESIRFDLVPELSSLVVQPSGEREPALAGQRLRALLALHRLSTPGGVTHGKWHSASGIRAGSSFDKARTSLKTAGYVSDTRKRWFLTATGREIVDGTPSTRSTSTPLGSGGADASSSPPSGGVYEYPRSGGGAVLRGRSGDMTAAERGTLRSA